MAEEQESESGKTLVDDADADTEREQLEADADRDIEVDSEVKQEPKKGASATSRAEQRIQKLANEARELRAQSQQYQERIRQLETPAEKRMADEKAREEAKRFYQDPAAYVLQAQDKLRQEFNEMTAQHRDLASYQSDLEVLKASPGWSKELNDAMVTALERYGLTDPAKLAAFGRSKAIRMAYEASTGKDWGHWSQDGYNTRRTKERLSRPGSGGGTSTRGLMLSPEQYDKAMNDLSRKAMDPDEQGRKMQEYNAALDAWAAANQGG